MIKAIVTTAHNRQTKENGWMVKVYDNWPKRSHKYIRAWFTTWVDAKKEADEINDNQQII